MSKQAIVLGGTDDHKYLIKILQSEGFYVTLIDYYENPPAKDVADEHIRESTLDAEKVLAIAREKSPDLVVSACIDQALLTMAYVCEELSLPCHISYDTALELTNKVYMKKRLVENNIPTSQFVIIEGESDIKQHSLTYPLVVKPADANSSKGVTKVSDESELAGAVETALSMSASNKAVVEEYFEGEEFSVDVVIKDGVTSVVMATKNIKNKNNHKNFTIVQNSFPATTDANILGKINEIAQSITDAYKIKNGPLLVQLLINSHGDIRVIEFSARIGGGSKWQFIHEVTGFDAVQYFIDMLLKKTTQDVPMSPNYGYGLMHYIYTKPGLIERFEGFDELKEKDIIKHYFLYKTEGSQVTSAISSTDRAAGIMLLDNEYSTLQEKLETANSTIKILDKEGEDIKLG